MKLNAPSCSLQIKVQPGAKREGLVWEENCWKVSISAPPVAGKANERLKAFTYAR
jgi:uncharacterized protein YggU (UPF0235/DUF167 family)